MPEDLLDDNTALGLLRAVHRHIDELLNTGLTFEQADFVQQATTMLLQEIAVHDTLEKELFRPFVRSVLPEREVLYGYPRRRQLEQAMEEDARVRQLAERLNNANPADQAYFETIAELARAFQHHTYMQEEYVFPLLEMNDPYTHNLLVQLATDMRIRKDKLLASLRSAPTTKLASRQARGEHTQALESPQSAVERPQEGAHGS